MLALAQEPLLQLLGRLRNTYSQPDPGDLRERAIHLRIAGELVELLVQLERQCLDPVDELRAVDVAGSQ